MIPLAEHLCLPLAEIPYPRIDPILVDLGGVKIRWYGLSYVFAFVAAYLVLKDLAKRGRWPVKPEKVADVLFWGILGVFIGGRVGYILFYQIWMGDFEWSRIWRVWEGGMSFHGGLLGVIVAYLIYARKTKTSLGELFDGLTLATPIGLFLVRMANFINAELWGRVTTSWVGMRFPDYERVGGPENWEARGQPWLPDLRHPSQLYEAFGEGLFLYFLLRWLMLKKGIGGGRIAGLFLIGYGAIRFIVEFFREPDAGLGFVFLDLFTRGQQLCFVMVLAGIIVLYKSRNNPNPGPSPARAQSVAA